MTNRPDLKELYGKLCLACDGAGWIYVDQPWLNQDGKWQTCEHCNGGYTT